MAEHVLPLHTDRISSRGSMRMGCKEMWHWNKSLNPAIVAEITRGSFVFE